VIEIDLEGLPVPDDAPEPHTCVRVERPEPGLAVLVLDPPHRKLAVLDLPTVRDLDHALDGVLDDGTLRGLVVTGREPLAFAAGADVNAIGSIADEDTAQRLIRYGQAVFDRVARASTRAGGRLFTVAAVGGPVPGGAYELALACDRIVLADDPRSRVGLPEVKLGIAPGWGGTQRLPRRVGVPRALTAILSGRLYRARAASKLGLVDRLTPPEYLARVAADVALRRERCPRRERGAWSLLVDRNPLARELIKGRARKQVERETRGHYPAPLVALDLVAGAPSTPLPEGLEQEVRRIAPLATSSVTKSLTGLFGLTEDAKKLRLLPDGTPAARVGRAAVIGGGVMGGAIAGLLAERGVAVRLKDLDQGALDAAQREHRARVAKQRRRRRLEPSDADAAVDRLEVTTGGAGFSRCELALEAVAEVLAVKRSVLGELATAMADDAILATNTSSLSVAEIADGLPGPERVVGMHFFNPVHRMPLVEIVRGPATSDAVVARTARLALDLGKTPVVVADVAGFLVNRLLGPYLDEALRLFENGAEPATVDAALRAFGMPMGPFELLDEVGLDIASHAAASLEAAYGERMIGSRQLQGLVEAGELGKKTGRGIYVHAEGKRRGGATSRPLPRNPRFARLGGRSAVDAALTSEAIVDRCVLAMLAEGARALEEEVVAGPRELDLATVFGMGFAPFRGGLLRYADRRGVQACAEACAALAAAPGVKERTGGPARFEPAAVFAEAGRRGGFHAL